MKLYIYIRGEPDLPPIVAPTENPVFDIKRANERGVYVDREGTRWADFKSINIGAVKDFVWYPPHRISKIVVVKEEI